MATPSLPPGQPLPTPTHSITSSGPFNPTAVLPPKVVRRILELDFLEMAEVTLDPEPSPVLGRPAPPITDISKWVERYSLMAATLATRFPEKAPELFAYQATIVRAERNYEAGWWVAYDRQFRREALAKEDLNWSVMEPRLYNEAFTGWAQSIPRCNFCLQDDHTGQSCPSNPNGSWPGWTPGHGSLHPLVGPSLRWQWQQTPVARQTFAGASTRASVGSLAAATPMPVGIVGASTHGSLVPITWHTPTNAHGLLSGHPTHPCCSRSGPQELYS